MKDDRKLPFTDDEGREIPREAIRDLFGDDGEIYAHGAYAFTKYLREKQEKAAALAAAQAAQTPAK